MVKSGQNKKGQKIFQLHRSLNPCSRLPAVKKDLKTAAARKFFGLSYFVTALVVFPSNIKFELGGSVSLLRVFFGDINKSPWCMCFSIQGAFTYDVRCFGGIFDLPTLIRYFTKYISLFSKIRRSLTYLPTQKSVVILM